MSSSSNGNLLVGKCPQQDN